MRVSLTVAYEGTNYHGWQVQPNNITIESVLNQALSDLLESLLLWLGPAGLTQGYMQWEMWQYLIQIPVFRQKKYHMR